MRGAKTRSCCVFVGCAAAIYVAACGSTEQPDGGSSTAGSGYSAGSPGSAGEAGRSSLAGATSGGRPDAGGSAGTEEGGAGGEALPDPAPITPPFDWVGVVGTGQSLSVGATAKYLSKSQPYGNLALVDKGPNPQYPIGDTSNAEWATTPLVEPLRATSPGSGAGYTDHQYPNNLLGESPHSGMANQLTALFRERGGSPDYVTVHTIVGWSGHALKDIDKLGTGRAYPASITEARAWKALADASGKTFGYGGIILTHGESDAVAESSDYAEGLYRLWQDYNADLKAITKQATDIPIFASQQSSKETPEAGNTALQLWRAGIDHPGKVICTGPKYAYKYSGDYLHLPAPAYRRLGEKYAEVFDHVVNLHQAWQPLGPTKVARNGAVITVTFAVPNPPLVWADYLAAPHQTVHTEWKLGRGFEVVDSASTPYSIAAIAIRGADVVVTLAAPPKAGISLRVRYAMTQDVSGNQGGLATGLRGQLRDSDPFVGIDAETIEVQVTKGSKTITSTESNGFLRRAAFDIVSGEGLAKAGMVVSHDSDDALTLRDAWPGDSGNVRLEFHYDMANYAVHFALAVP